MQKLLRFIRNNIIARIFVHLFVFNFFCMQCFGMAIVEQRPRLDFRPSDIRDVHLCNMPDASVEMQFIEDDFALAYQAEGYARTFSKRDAFYEGGMHHLRLDDGVNVSIDPVAHKIFCHSFLLDSSLRFSAIGCTLILNELVCQGLVNLLAETVSISGVLSSRDGIVMGASVVENLGTVDAPYINMYSNIFSNLGTIKGKEVSLTVESEADFKKDSSVFAADKITLRCGGSTEFESAAVSSKQIDIQSDMFEADASSLYARDSFRLNGRSIGFFNNTELSSGKSMEINTGRFRSENSRVESELIRAEKYSLEQCIRCRALNMLE